MAYENNGRGALFQNHKGKDAHPDWKGDIEFKGGVKYELSAWIKQDRNGKDYLSLSIGDVKDENARLPKHPSDLPDHMKGEEQHQGTPPEFDDVPY
jgi:hypothetical protein